MDNRGASHLCRAEELLVYNSLLSCLHLIYTVFALAALYSHIFYICSYTTLGAMDHILKLCAAKGLSCALASSSGSLTAE